jgi:hypothetical protein
MKGQPPQNDDIGGDGSRSGLDGSSCGDALLGTGRKRTRRQMAAYCAMMGLIGVQYFHAVRDGESQAGLLQGLGPAGAGDGDGSASQLRWGRAKGTHPPRRGHRPRIVYATFGRKRKSKGKERRSVPTLVSGYTWTFHNNGTAPPYQSRVVKTYPAEQTDETQLYPQIDSNDYPYNETLQVRSFPPQRGDFLGGQKIEDMVRPNCRPMAKWQTTFHPTCNVFHGLDTIDSMGAGELAFLGRGSWRDAWTMQSHQDERNFVFKTWNYAHRFEGFYYELNRVDAVVMEMLTSSPYVVDIYGYCGLSMMTQLASETLSKMADKLKWVEKLKLVREIAKGLSHLHGAGNSGITASIVHNDLNAAHIMVAEDGKTPLLNDFNIAQLMLWDDKSKKPCGFAGEFWNPQWRSPEEIKSYLGLEHDVLSSGVDIYALGNVIYRFLTGVRAWGKGHGSMTEEYKQQIADWKRRKGKTPPVPEAVMKEKETNASVSVLMQIMNKCFEKHPQDRPTAHDIVKIIDKALINIES